MCYRNVNHFVFCTILGCTSVPGVFTDHGVDLPHCGTMVRDTQKERKKMGRDRQRRNRREKDKRELLEIFMKSEKNERPWLNHEGYHDLTSYHAIRNVEREEKLHATSSAERE